MLRKQKTGSWEDKEDRSLRINKEKGKNRNRNGNNEATDQKYHQMTQKYWHKFRVKVKRDWWEEPNKINTFSEGKSQNRHQRK